MLGVLADVVLLVNLYRFYLKVENGVSSICAAETASVSLPNGLIKDVKFVDDESLMLIWCGECICLQSAELMECWTNVLMADSSRLLCFPYGGAPADPQRMPWVPLSENVSRVRKPRAHDSVAGLNLSDLSLLATYTRHTFPRGGTSQPERLEVNGRKGRRVVCVLDQDKLRYRVFDLDSSAEAVHTDHGAEEQVSNDNEAMSE